MRGSMGQVILLLLIAVIQIKAAPDVRVVGVEILSSAAYSGPIPEGGKTAFLIDQIFPERGSVFAFMGYFKNTNPTHLQIWRPAGTDFQLLLDRVMIPTTADVDKRSVIYLQGSQCIEVLPGDRVGFMNENNEASIGFTFMTVGNAGKHLSIANRTVPQLYETITFDNLNMPYEFAMSVAYDIDIGYYQQNGFTCRTGLMVPPEPTTTTPDVTTPDMRGPPGEQGPKGDNGDEGPVGPRGPKGDKGDAGSDGGGSSSVGPRGEKGDTGSIGDTGDKGDKGDKGDTGATGERGTKGETGATGKTGPAAPVAAATGELDCSECRSGLLHPNLILGLIIWLLIITLLVVMLLVLMVRRRSELTQQDSLRALQAGGQPWREDIWKEYHVDTISNRPR